MNMPSGWEQHSEYGSPPQGPKELIVTLVLAGLVGLAMFGCSRVNHADEAPLSSDTRSGIGPSTPAQLPVEPNLVGQATVIDGDTLDIRGERVRLWGIDAPESAQTCLDGSGTSQPA
jgi:endonuclease YncB( thermonuclease family)